MTDVVEGWTEGLRFRLEKDGVAVLLSSTDEVALILRARDGRTIATSGNVLIASTSGGEVLYSPDPLDLIASRGPYYARFRLTQAGKISFFPNGEPDQWLVHKP